MKPILIIKTGTLAVFPELLAKYGDFDNLIIGGIEQTNDNFIICNAYDGDLFPEYSDISGIIITGSPTMITEPHEWINNTVEWVKTSFLKNIPTLGICFGHQLIAIASGGKVGFHPGGMEIGYVDVLLNRNACGDPLFSNISASFNAYTLHSQTVLALSENTVNLASNPFESNNAFVLDSHIWGVQFHPEFTKSIMEDLIFEMRNELENDGFDIQQLKSSVTQSDYGYTILKNFYKLVRAQNE